jgi:hypothetical protein
MRYATAWQVLVCSEKRKEELSLTALNGHQKRHNLADKQEHSSSLPVVLTRQFLAESAKIGQNLAGNPFYTRGL